MQTLLITKCKFPHSFPHSSQNKPSISDFQKSKDGQDPWLQLEMRQLPELQKMNPPEGKRVASGQKRAPGEGNPQSQATSEYIKMIRATCRTNEGVSNFNWASNKKLPSLGCPLFFAKRGQSALFPPTARSPRRHDHRQALTCFKFFP